MASTRHSHSIQACTEHEHIQKFLFSDRLAQGCASRSQEQFRQKKEIFEWDRAELNRRHLERVKRVERANNKIGGNKCPRPGKLQIIKY